MSRAKISRTIGLAVVVAAVAAPAASTGAPIRGRPGSALVAYARSRHVLVYPSPHARRPTRVLPNPFHGTRLSFLVRAERPGWVRVFLPVRPNASSGWVRSRQVRLLADEYHVRIDLRRHVLRVWRRGRLVMRRAVGVGRAETPTPVGRYYVVELIQTDDPGGAYGPYAFGLSAHSDVLRRFDGADGQVGIHGTDYPQGLGTGVSHGCIRIDNRSIVRLARTMPLGTQVTIIRGALPAPVAEPRPPVLRPARPPALPQPRLAAARALPPRAVSAPAAATWVEVVRRYVDALLALFRLL